LLLDENGNQTAADGATVNFTWAGNATYVNNGCQAPFIPLIATATTNAVAPFCPGDTIALFGNSTGNIVSRNWNGGNGILISSNQDTAFYIISPNDNGNINFIYSASNFCNNTATDTVTISIQQGNSTMFSVSPNDTVCTGENVTLSVSGGNSFLWNTTATTSDINVTTGGNYSVTVTGTCGTQVYNQAIIVLPTPTVTIGNDITICQGDNVELTASGATAYLWNTGSTNASINVSPSVSTSYFVTATDNNYCFASDTILVNVSNNLQAQIAGNSSICLGDFTSLTASGGSVYSWSNGATSESISVNPTENTTYSVTVSSGSSCADSATISIIVNQLPTINAGNDSSICEGGSITLTATGGIEYIWSNGDNENTINVQPLNTTTYTVTATDNNGCSNTSTITISVQQKPANLDIISTAETCPGSNDGSITINNNSANIQYSINNVNFQDDNIFENLSPNNYTIYIKDSNCTFSENVIISEAEPVNLNVDSIIELEKGNTITINITLTSPDYTVNITPSIGLSCNDCLIPNVSDLEENTTYVVTATNGNCVYTDTFTVIILEKEFIIFPSAFTPNNDNLNDIFKPSFSGIINNYSLKIYNRWGEELFQSNSISLGWDGTYKGKNQPLETYIWYCTYKDFRNEEKLIKGNLTLIR
jgi:gliding motility-associated-like protein